MSLRKAIDAKCRECIYDPMGAGTWLAQVEACTSPDCPLYPYRPVTEVTRAARAKAEGRSRPLSPKAHEAALKKRTRIE